MVWKANIEAKADIELSTNDDIGSWTARWAAMSTSRCLVGKDGRTPDERRKGR